MPQVQTTLTGHSSKSGTAKNGKGWTMHLFTAADGVIYQTFDTGLGNKAYGLLNQPVTVIFEPEPRGEFVNNTLKSVDAVAGGVQAAQQGSPPPAAVQSPVAPTVAGTTATYTVLPVAAPTQTQDDRQVAIMRQSAVERAIRYFAATQEPFTITDVYRLSDELVSYFVNGTADAAAAPAAQDDVGF